MGFNKSHSSYFGASHRQQLDPDLPVSDSPLQLMQLSAMNCPGSIVWYLNYCEKVNVTGSSCKDHKFEVFIP
jgi:hypothetical protein